MAFSYTCTSSTFSLSRYVFEVLCVCVSALPFPLQEMFILWREEKKGEQAKRVQVRCIEACVRHG